jgi:gluconokinase
MVVVIMGVSGSGKSTIGAALAAAVGGRFVDADDFHPAQNVAKMRAGTALTEADREPWLRELRIAIDRWLEEGGVTVLACSTLTKLSRERLGVARAGITLVFLHGERALIAQRLRGREHFMPATLLDSQYATLEPPAAGEALTFDMRRRPEDLVAAIRAGIGI